MRIDLPQSDLERIARILRDYRGLCEDQVFAKCASKYIMRQVERRKGGVK